MRLALAALLVGLPGCLNEPAVTDRSVWWAPVASWGETEMDRPVLQLLADHGIEFIFVSSRGMRIRVPYERHEEAIALLRGAEFAGRLKIHSVLAGPRPGANLPLLGVASEVPGWIELLSFDLSSLPAPKLQGALNARGIECGIISYAWNPKKAVVYVPPGTEEIARAALNEASLGVRLPPR